MFLRNILLAIGGVFVLVGVGLFIVWFGQMRNRPVAVVEKPVESRPAVLAAARTIDLGTLLRKEDIAWKDVGPGEVRPGYLMRGQISEAEFLGAISRRNFAEGEPLIASEFVKPGDRQFLAAVLKPGNRAVSIFVDAAQSAAGMVLPGDRVDVILTQSFGEQATDPGRRTVSETMLRDVRVIAIDQSLTQSTNVATAMSAEARIPKTVTLELLERQAEALMVAAQLGKFQLAVRPLERVVVERPEGQTEAGPVWASDVSPALREIGAQVLRKCNPDESLSGSSLECLVRRPPNSSGGSAPFLSRQVIAPGNVERGPK
ncbi:Flp pilus assembly protein CpaB [Bradyrhizobium sp. SZCCHNR2012]|uniref:Flp pilus assembly protein CpaB n=1 Tax=Bradyrhizobium sp. SZCCHNR2012 TaxID=3057377 RepID=UPI0028E59B6E|nr:Flp pilus assembly protein CpaB [Bradyrhizobium sp. SZCCHNR2012]